LADDTLNQLNLVIRDVFVDDDIVVGRESTAEEVEGWDSLSHARLIMEIERRFGIRFAPGEVMDLANVGELADAIDAKTRS
jgi:acyl carrier protein